MMHGAFVITVAWATTTFEAVAGEYQVIVGGGFELKVEGTGFSEADRVRLVDVSVGCGAELSRNHSLGVAHEVCELIGTEESGYEKTSCTPSPISDGPELTSTS